MSDVLDVLAWTFLALSLEFAFLFLRKGSRKSKKWKCDSACDAELQLTHSNQLRFFEKERDFKHWVSVMSDL